MKVSKAEAAKHRSSLVAAAAAVIQEHGFKGASATEISARAGLTQGAFYARFAAKGAIAAEACRKSHEDGLIAWKALRGTTPNDASAYVRQYLLDAHVVDAGSGCPMAACVSEVRREDREVRDAFTAGFVELAELMRDGLAATTDPLARRRSLMMIAALTGSVAMARAVQASDPSLAVEIIAASREELRLLAERGEP